MSQYALTLPHTTAYGREQFIVSDCNRDAHGWIEAWPKWLASGLILYGPTGCGKSHLSALWQAPAIRLSPADIGKTPSADLLKETSCAVLEDAHLADETGLFHLLNHIAAQKGSLLLTAPMAPALWNTGLADLRSRLLALPACAIAAPDDTLLARVMRKQFADRQVSVADEVIQYLLPRMERSFAAASAMVEMLDKASMAQKRPITLPLVRSVLEQEPRLF